MSNNATPDEQPKQKVGRKLVAEKRLYFFPTHGRSVTATSQESASAQLKKTKNTREVGDGDS